MAPHDSTIDIKPRSRVVTDGIEATTSRGMLRAVGMGSVAPCAPRTRVVTAGHVPP